MNRFVLAIILFLSPFGAFAQDCATESDVIDLLAQELPLVQPYDVVTGVEAKIVGSIFGIHSARILVFSNPYLEKEAGEPVVSMVFQNLGGCYDVVINTPQRIYDANIADIRRDVREKEAS